MRQAEYGVWQDFYYNDCFADVKHTAYMVRKVMGLVREFEIMPAMTSGIVTTAMPKRQRCIPAVGIG